MVLVVLLILVLTVIVPVHGREWIVAEDSSGDFTLFSEACTAAGSGDTITVMPGHYSEPDIYIVMEEKEFLIRGAGVSPSDVSLQVRMNVIYCDGAFFQDLRFHNSPMRSLYVKGGIVNIHNCHFEGNGDSPSMSSGGAIYCLFGSSVMLEDCVFVGNLAMGVLGEGGAIHTVACSSTIRRCVFKENRATDHGGAILGSAETIIEDCLFLGYVARNGAAASLGWDSVLRSSTLYENEVTQDGGGALEVYGDRSSSSDCIFAGTVFGPGVFCSSYSVVECSLFWQNEMGAGDPWACGIVESSCLWEDPLWCDPAQGDFGLLPSSPCLPENHEGLGCDLIGAFGEGCGQIPVREMTWGEVKALYR